MKIDCYLSRGCGTEEELRENIQHAAAIENVEVEINLQRIDDKAAIDLHLSGSPTVFVDGKELQPRELIQSEKSVGFS